MNARLAIKWLVVSRKKNSMSAIWNGWTITKNFHEIDSPLHIAVMSEAFSSPLGTLVKMNRGQFDFIVSSGVRLMMFTLFLKWCSVQTAANVEKLNRRPQVAQWYCDASSNLFTRSVHPYGFVHIRLILYSGTVWENCAKNGFSWIPLFTLTWHY